MKWNKIKWKKIICTIVYAAGIGGLLLALFNSHNILDGVQFFFILSSLITLVYLIAMKVLGDK